MRSRTSALGEDSSYYIEVAVAQLDNITVMIKKREDIVKNFSFLSGISR